MGKRTNQTCVQVIHAGCIAMFASQAELVGIRVGITEGSCTSPASLPGLDPLSVGTNGDETTHVSSDKHFKRGLYRASDGQSINAGINGAGNVMRKDAPDAFGQRAVEDGQEAFASLDHPVRIVVPLTNANRWHWVANAHGQ